MNTPPPSTARHNMPTPIHEQSGVPHGHVPGYLPGSASLVEQLDQRVLIVLRDGKHLIGTMVSYDQFSNIVLTDALERRMVIDQTTVYYADVPLGLYVVRGDAMVLMGQVGSTTAQWQPVSLEELEDIQERLKQQELQWDFDTDLVA